MITLLTSFSYDATILPHFMRHYVPLCDRMVIGVVEDVPGVRRRVEQAAEEYAPLITIVEGSERWKQTRYEANNKEEIRVELGLGPSDWVIPVDPDEFVMFEKTPREIVASKPDYLWVAGRWRDRVATDGKLKPLKETPSIWEQYPRAAPISDLIVRGWTQKAVLVRGDVPLESGHHSPIDRKLPRAPVEVPVDHFKWREGIIETLRVRVRNCKRAGLPVAVESERLLAYYKKYGAVARWDRFGRFLSS